MTRQHAYDLEELLASEGLVPVRQFIPERHCDTVVHWITNGLSGTRLEATKNGRTWVSSYAALARFRARLRGEYIHTPTETASSMAKRARAASARRRAM